MTSRSLLAPLLAAAVSSASAICITRVQPDGRLHVKTQYMKAGQWVDDRDMHYVEDKNAEVRFK